MYNIFEFVTIFFVYALNIQTNQLQLKLYHFAAQKMSNSEATHLWLCGWCNVANTNEAPGAKAWTYVGASFALQQIDKLPCRIYDKIIVLENSQNIIHNNLLTLIVSA